VSHIQRRIARGIELEEELAQEVAALAAPGEREGQGIVRRYEQQQCCNAKRCDVVLAGGKWWRLLPCGCCAAEAT
jgi:hypothetical protein